MAVAGWYTGVLRNSGEKISIFDSHNILVLSLDFLPSSGWPSLAAGHGYSLELIDVNGDPDSPANWKASSTPNGTPGLPPGSVVPPVVVINEVMANNVSAVANGGAYPDWVELYNSGAAVTDLGGWSLSDDGNPAKFVFPPGTSIQPDGYLVIWCDTNSAAPGLHTGFGLKDSGDEVYLFDPNSNRVDAITFGLQAADYTLSRLGTQWQLGVPTPNAPNTAAALAAISNASINEWMANPPPGGADWIELYNGSAAAPIALKDLTIGNSDTLFTIRALSFLAPHAYIQLFADEAVGPDHLDLKLSKEGDSVALYDSTGAQLSRVTFGLQVEGVSQGRLPDGGASIVSFNASASPGASNYVLAYTGPILNEVMARNVSAYTNSSGVVADWVEIFNPGSSPFSLSGWSLALDSQSAARWFFPTGYLLGAQSYVLISCDPDSASSTNVGAFNTGHAISSESGAVYLFNPAGQIMDLVEFGFQPPDFSIGRTGGSWQLLASPTPGLSNSPPAALGSVQNLRINEWLAAPAGGDDWLELYNLDTLPVNLAGLFVTDDPTVAGLTNSVLTPLSFIGGNGWVQLKADGDISKGRDHVNFSLDGLGETLRIYSKNFVFIDGVDFGLQTEGVAQGRLLDGTTTLVNLPMPTPGEGNWLQAPVLINEALTHTDPPFEDAIELFNPTESTLDLGGWFLSNSRSNLKKYRIPGGIFLPPGGFVVFYENQFNANNPGTPFTLNSAHGDEIWLSAATSGGTLTGYRATASFGAAENGISFGHFTTSLGPEFTAMSSKTFGSDNPSTVIEFRNGTGATNAYPKIGPLILNEIMYHPPDMGGQDNSVDEYIELFNVSGSDVALFDPAHATNTWRLRGGISFEFPTGASVGTAGYALVVSFDPANSTQATLFRNRSNVPIDVPIYGPYSGKLNNSGETVELVRPDSPQVPPHPDAGFVPYIRVDRVDYSDVAPWASGADGSTNGQSISLQRVSSAVYGNEPLNWVAGVATAGRINGSAILGLPVISQQPQDRGGLAGATLTFTVGASGPGPLSYQWRFNGVPIRNATNSSLTVANMRSVDEGNYSVFVANPAGACLERIGEARRPGAAIAHSASAKPGRVTRSERHIQRGRRGWRIELSVAVQRQHHSGVRLLHLFLTNVQPPSAGQYSVVVSNISGVVVSDKGYLVMSGAVYQF